MQCSLTKLPANNKVDKAGQFVYDLVMGWRRVTHTKMKESHYQQRLITLAQFAKSLDILS